MPCPSKYRSKMILDRPNHFGQVEVRLFWTIAHSCATHKAIIVASNYKKVVVKAMFLIWTCSKRFGPD